MYIYIRHSMCRYIYQFICRAFLLSIHQSFNSVSFQLNIILQYFGYENTAKVFKIRKSRVSQQSFATTCTCHDSIISEDWCDSRCQLYNPQCRWGIQQSCISWSLHTVKVMCWHQDSRNTSKHSPGASLWKLEVRVKITLNYEVTSSWWWIY